MCILYIYIYISIIGTFRVIVKIAPWFPCRCSLEMFLRWGFSIHIHPHHLQQIQVSHWVSLLWVSRSKSPIQPRYSIISLYFNQIQPGSFWRAHFTSISVGNPSASPLSPSQLSYLGRDPKSHQWWCSRSIFHSNCRALRLATYGKKRVNGQLKLTTLCT